MTQTTLILDCVFGARQLTFCVAYSMLSVLQAPSIAPALFCVSSRLKMLALKVVESTGAFIPTLAVFTFLLYCVLTLFLSGLG